MQAVITTMSQNTTGSPTMIRRAQTSPQHKPVPPPPASFGLPGYSPRPSSARLSRPTSGQPTSRPQSVSPPNTRASIPLTEVPTAQAEERTAQSPAPSSDPDRQEPPPTTPVPMENGTNGINQQE